VQFGWHNIRQIVKAQSGLMAVDSLDRPKHQARTLASGNDVKTPGSSDPLPLTTWLIASCANGKKSWGLIPLSCFPGPRRPISTVKTAWKATLGRAGVPHFPIYNLRHAFCTRPSSVAPDAVIQRAIRHTSPKTKRRYQLSMVEQVREAMERANQRVYRGQVTIQ
jgi:integrase